ncbi:MAG: T9SS type A sorting domain-containing protein [Ignavibacteriaceae bacterium]
MSYFTSLLLVLILNSLLIAQTDEPGCATLYSEETEDWSQRGGKYLTSLGELKVLVVFAKFKDDHSLHNYWPASSYPEEMEMVIDSNIQAGSSHYLNLTNYYRQMSFGNFKVTGKAVLAETPYPKEHYIPLNGNYPNRSLANTDILKVIDDRVDYGEFDNWTYISNYYHKNAPDGIVDMIIIIWRGLVFADNWCGEASLGGGAEFFVENNLLRIKMGYGGYPGEGIFGSGVTVQYWGERSRERNFKVIVHEIAHWLINSEHPYSLVNHSFWGMLTLATEGICANSFERERVAWLNPHLIEGTILSAPIGDYVTTPSSYKFQLDNGYPGEIFFFENHQQVSIYDNITSNINDRGIFVLHFAHKYYMGDCVRLITSNGFWNWESPFTNNCWGNLLPSFKKADVNRNGFGNRDRIILSDTCSGFLYSFINAYGKAECNDWLHGYNFKNSFDTSYNDLFSPWSNPPSNKWTGQQTDFSMQVVNKNETIVTARFITQNSIGLKPSKPFLNWDPAIPDSNYKFFWVYLAWGADLWDKNPIEPDVTCSELQRKCGPENWITVYSGTDRVWSDSNVIYNYDNNESVYFRVRFRDSQNYWSLWSEIYDTKTIIPSLISSTVSGEKITSFPYDYMLLQNYPNPFNLITVISYQLPVSSDVTLKVFDILGNEIETLVDEYKPAGKYEVDLQSAVGNRQLASGVYFYQLRAGEYTAVKKMVLIK